MQLTTLKNKRITLKSFIECCNGYFEKLYGNPNGKDAKETAKQMLAEIKLMAEISQNCKWQVVDGVLNVKYKTNSSIGSFKIPIEGNPALYEKMMCEALKIENYSDNLNN